MKYHIWTVGCQMNVADSRKLAAGLDRAGCAAVDAPDDADLVVLNTCSVREHAEDRAIGQLGRLKKLRARGQRLQDRRHGLHGRPAPRRPRAAASPTSTSSPARRTSRRSWRSPASTTPAASSGPTTFATPDCRRRPSCPSIHGCDKFCTYCIVPYRRGREKSRTIDDIRNEVEHYCARGVREVTLLGQTVEAYGHDLPDAPDLGDLMRAIHDIAGPRAHPLPHVVPEGHDGAHHRCRRGAAEGLRELQHPRAVGRRRRARPHAPRLHARRVPREVRAGPVARSRDAAMVTDVIVGFCGETDAEFQQHLRPARSACASTRCTSPRTRRAPARSPTASWPTTCPPTSSRSACTRSSSSKRASPSEINQRLLDTEQEVLVESRREGRWTGRNRLGKLVHFEGEARGRTARRRPHRARDRLVIARNSAPRTGPCVACSARSIHSHCRC